MEILFDGKRYIVFTRMLKCGDTCNCPVLEVAFVRFDKVEFRKNINLVELLAKSN